MNINLIVVIKKKQTKRKNELNKNDLLVNLENYTNPDFTFDGTNIIKSLFELWKSECKPLPNYEQLKTKYDYEFLTNINGEFTNMINGIISLKSDQWKENNKNTLEILLLLPSAFEMIMNYILIPLTKLLHKEEFEHGKEDIQKIIEIMTLNKIGRAHV